VWRDAVASLGVRPTFGGGDRLLEIHLFEQEVDLYGRRLCCAFIERLRAEERFATVEALRAQIDRDCAAARVALAAAR
jgi:riboflavin kinase/FMN adenylyltransferase